MEFVDSSTNSGRLAFLDNSQDNKNTKNKVHDDSTDQDHFQCTFFRQPKSKYVVQHYPGQIHDHTPRSPDEPSILFNLSDTSTDSESELDEPVNGTSSCSPTTSRNSKNLRMEHCQVPSFARKTSNVPKVTFDPELPVRTGRPMKSRLKSSARREIENAAKLEKKRGCLMDTVNLKLRKHRAKNSEMLYPRTIVQETGLEDRAFRIQRSRNPYLNSILRNTKESGDRYGVAGNGENRAGKPTGNKVVRNKCLLKSMRKVIRAMCREQGPFEVSLESVESIKPKGKNANVDLVAQRKSEKEPIETVKISSGRLDRKLNPPKPAFKRPELEKLLNDSMKQAVQRYRSCAGTWNSLLKLKATGTAVKGF